MYMYIHVDQLYKYMTLEIVFDSSVMSIHSDQCLRFV